MTTPAPQVRSVVVVGAGLVGLSTAWFLQERGVAVTVIDRTGVAAGSSWGNAGWISPGLVLPLPEPSVLRYGLTSLLDPSSALYVPFTFDPKLWAFLARFSTHCTMKQWRNAMSSYVAINHLAFSAYDDLAHGGVAAATNESPIMAAFEHDNQSRNLRHELDLLEQLGQPVLTNDLSGDEARRVVPQLSDRVRLVMQLNGQRFFDPGAFANALADAVRQRGGSVVTGVTVTDLRDEGARETVVSRRRGGARHGSVAQRSRQGRGRANAGAGRSWLFVLGSDRRARPESHLLPSPSCRVHAVSRRPARWRHYGVSLRQRATRPATGQCAREGRDADAARGPLGRHVRRVGGTSTGHE
jgi:glycine/D-amino acid oxidase-like deaminating enzyme